MGQPPAPTQSPTPVRAPASEGGSGPVAAPAALSAAARTARDQFQQSQHYYATQIAQAVAALEGELTPAQWQRVRGLFMDAAMWQAMAMEALFTEAGIPLPRWYQPRA